MKHLMIFRCGKNSIHKSWIHYAKKLIDIAFVYYDDSDFSNDEPTYSNVFKGTKLTGIHEFIVKNPEVINKYDYFWLFDDDLHIPYLTFKGIIDFIAKYKPALSAPSLTQESYFTHPITLQQPSLFLRGTNFVEVMAPIMSKQFLQDTLEQFIEFPMWGIERCWQHLLWEYKEVAFIYDQWPIIHTRPIGTGSIYKLAEKMGIDIIADEMKSIELYGKKFADSQSNILFGLTNTENPTLVTASNLRSHLELSHQVLEELYNETSTKIKREILNKTSYPNMLFSQFLSFANVQKLLSINNISANISNILVREWIFGSKTQNTSWCNNMVFDINGRVRNYYNDNEYYWDVKDDIFHILSKDRKVLTKFDQLEIIDNTMILTGKFQGNNDILHYLKEKKQTF